MFSLNYVCDNCGNVVPTKTTDGRVHPPPDSCFKCSVLYTGVSSRRKKQTGQCFQGLKLEIFSKIEKTWRVQCLFCLSTALVKYNNIGKQMSCGCLKSSSLKPLHFNHDNTAVECDCSACGLRKSYSLLTGLPISCDSGC